MIDILPKPIPHTATGHVSEEDYRRVVAKINGDIPTDNPQILDFRLDVKIGRLAKEEEARLGRELTPAECRKLLRQLSPSERARLDADVLEAIECVECSRLDAMVDGLGIPP